jgi:hypothetical protein
MTLHKLPSPQQGMELHKPPSGGLEDSGNSSYFECHSPAVMHCLTNGKADGSLRTQALWASTNKRKCSLNARVLNIENFIAAIFLGQKTKII